MIISSLPSKITLSSVLCAAASISLVFAVGDVRANDLLQEKGHYIATAADCIACHTTPGGKPYAGGRAFLTPFGTVYSTNITPSSNGIANITEEQFAKSVREGIRADGKNLYPAMPYTEYKNITDDDIHALYAFFKNTVPSVSQKNLTNNLKFPFNIRYFIKFWNLFQDDEKVETVSSESPQWNRGKYLVEVLSHCGTCHTPRNFMMSEKTSQKFSGASLGAWYAPNITPSSEGIGNWSTDDLTQYLKSGHNSLGAYAGGEMLEAIDHSFSKMTDEDLNAIAVYLRTAEKVGTNKIVLSDKTLPVDPLFALNAAQNNPEKMDGSTLYQAFCASCHGDHGQGDALNNLPSMRGNPLFRLPNTDNIVAAILQGVWPEGPHTQGMPAFSHRLSDDQIVKLVNFLTTTFGNNASQTTLQRVQAIRKTLPPNSSAQ